MVVTVCVLVYAALAYRIRQVLQDHDATFPNQQGKPVQNPTARWVFHDFVGIHVLRIPGQWDPVVVHPPSNIRACFSSSAHLIYDFIAEYS